MPVGSTSLTSDETPQTCSSATCSIPYILDRDPNGSIIMKSTLGSLCQNYARNLYLQINEESEEIGCDFWLQAQSRRAYKDF